MSNNMKGFNTHRHLDNPTEKELHDNFIFSERENPFPLGEGDESEK